LPAGVTEDHDLGVSPILSLGERAADQRRDTQHVEELDGDTGSLHVARLAVTGQIDTARSVPRDGTEHGALLLPVEEIRR
jgi:hypothetical protein